MIHAPMHCTVCPCCTVTLSMYNITQAYFSSSSFLLSSGFREPRDRDKDGDRGLRSEMRQDETRPPRQVAGPGPDPDPNPDLDSCPRRK